LVDSSEYIERQSTAPDGATYEIPSEDEIQALGHRLVNEAAVQRSLKRQVVVVQGIGAVGTAVAAVLAGARTPEGTPTFFVIAVDLATPGSYWKIPKLNAGETPFWSADSELETLIAHGVKETGNLRATTSTAAYSVADVIVVDVGVDVSSREFKNAGDIHVELGPLQAAIKVIAREMSPDALVLVETTLPPGTCETVVLDCLVEERGLRGIDATPRLAYAYERVTPGPNYVASIKRTPRGYAGIDDDSAEAASRFLGSFLATDIPPLHRFERMASAEFAKLLENSYRAANIAFIHEWTMLAESMGIDLFDVVESIRVRKGTHDNIRYPGLGVGGYCLPKDPLFAQWAGMRGSNDDVLLPMTLQAVQINRLMPLHTLDLLVNLAGGDVSGKTILVLGVSYTAGIGDSRDSPSQPLVQGLVERGAVVIAHDPYLVTWPEMPTIQMTQELERVLATAEGVVFAVPHRQYGEPIVASLVSRPTPALIVDAQNIISDSQALELHEAGHRLRGVGKGQWTGKGFDL